MLNVFRALVSAPSCIARSAATPRCNPIFRPSRKAVLGVHLALVWGLSAGTALAADDIPLSAAQIKTMDIRLQRLDAPATLAGTIYPAQVVLPRQQEQLIAAPVAGVVAQVLVEDHALVVAGQPLLRLNSPEFGELQLKLIEATNQARMANATLAREQSLFAEGIVPERRVLEATSAGSDARARVQQSTAALRLAGADDATLRRIASGEAQDSLVLRAPKAGTVLAIDAKLGQRVADADPLLRLGALGDLWLDIALPADHATAWAATGTIQVVGRAATAKPISIGAEVRENQTLSLRALVNAHAEGLRPGEFVQVRVPFAATGEAWSLPLNAVVYQDDKPYVFVRTANGFRAQAVKVADSAGESVAVSGEFKAGDQIAVASVIALKAAWLGVGGAEEE